MLMDDLDIDDLLECDDIESTAFISSSKQLLSVLDNVINCIDDRINYKKAAAVGGGAGYYGGLYGSYQQEDFNLLGGNNSLSYTGGYQHKGA